MGMESGLVHAYQSSLGGRSRSLLPNQELRSKKGSKIYAQRKAIVEPVNGQIKEVRGLRRFLLRGLEKVDAEWHLISATHNLLKLFRFRRSQQQELMAASG